ncbi:recombinase family protein [Actinomadura sp. LOL_016]|uniref:recombinase family protein n=1 Tax=unclassified Actinomadura TaxID=2626254 RepID=UPI003A80F6FA
MPKPGTDPIRFDPHFRPPFRPLWWPSEPAGHLPGHLRGRNLIGHGRPRLPATLHRQADRRPPTARPGRADRLRRPRLRRPRHLQPPALPGPEGFTKLLHEAAVGDTIRIADAARLFRSVADILALRPVLIRRGLHLRVESGLLSGIDLAADDPGTKMMVNALASVLEFQRDMISENTRQGVAAAEASGKTLGRPTALAPDKAAEVVTAYSQGAAVKALAREHHVAPKTIRRVLDAAGARQLPAEPAALPVPEEPSGLPRTRP